MTLPKWIASLLTLLFLVSPAFPQGTPGITRLTSKGGTVTITDPNGPVANLESSGSGGGGLGTGGVLDAGTVALVNGKATVTSGFAFSTNQFFATYFTAGPTTNISLLYVSNVVAGTSFDIHSAFAQDTNSVCWCIVNPRSIGTNFTLNVAPGQNIYFTTNNNLIVINASTLGASSSTTIIGLTNANTPLYFPFMGETYTAKFAIVSEAFSGLTNGVFHWRGDGANPGSVCVSPREFWFQTNFNWTWPIGGNYRLQALVYSNDVGILNEGEVYFDVQIQDTQYGNPPISSGIGFQQWYGTIAVQNGTASPPVFIPGVLNQPFVSSPQCSNSPPLAVNNGSFLIYLTNDIGQQSGFTGTFSERVIIHTVELTTGTNWPSH